MEIDEIVNYKPKQTTQFLDKNGEVVANIFDSENRVIVEYKDIPARVIESLLAIEDTTFFEHEGINTEAILRAIAKNIQAGKFVEGASTITQQLVKTMLLTREKKISRKAKEALLTYQVEASLTKEEILERYLNEVYFGHSYYGIKTAANGYFNKDLKSLTLKEIAMLVALPRAPSYYDPTKNYQFSISRANNVISRLKNLGWINDAEFSSATKEMPIVYNNTLTRNKAPYAVDEAIRSLQNNFPDIKTGGYQVNLTLDIATQKIADEALRSGYETISSRDGKNKAQREKGLNGAIVVVENSTGRILALSGGVNYAKSSFNRAVFSSRQAGSAIKPFVYEIGLENGMTPNSTLDDSARTYSFRTPDGKIKEWKPQNYKKEFNGVVTLREALTHSLNLATINLVERVGISKVHSRLEEFGFKNIPYNLSIVLGSFGVTPFDMSKQMTLFSNNGNMIEPHIVLSIKDKKGKITNITEPASKQTINQSNAYWTTSMMKDVVLRGTGTGANVSGIEVAGKTGTTNNNVDVWFCGFSPEIQAVVWYGNDDNKPMASGETGGRTAAPVFGQFMRNYVAKYPQTKRSFSSPAADSNSTDSNSTDTNISRMFN
jgi:penicillin-binding protein 1A